MLVFINFKYVLVHFKVSHRLTIEIKNSLYTTSTFLNRPRHIYKKTKSRGLARGVLEGVVQNTNLFSCVFYIYFFVDLERVK
jgi:hypothetical protein